MKPRLLLGTLVVAAALAAAEPAAAAEPGAEVRQGWWTAANPSGSVPPSITGPDVPADGLLVQGSPSDTSPAAVSAIVAAVPSDGRPSSLVVHLAPDSPPFPGSTLKACPLTAPDIEPVQGGTMTNAPAYDCTDAVAVAPDTDGTTFTFDAAPLLVGDIVAAALVPGTPTTRVVLAKPGDDLLTVTGPTTSAEQPDGGALLSDDSFDVGSTAPVVDQVALPGLAAPAMPAVPSPAPIATGVGGASVTDVVPAVALPIDPGANGIAVTGALLAVVAAAITWRLAGRRRPVRFAATSVAGS